MTRLLKPEGFVKGLAFDPEGLFLASSQADGTLIVWDVSAGKSEMRKRLCPKARHLEAWQAPHRWTLHTCHSPHQTSGI